ncbi:MAG: 16S rRNA processing protein RimM, partial [Oscillospiraceae bacterium]|nr:16S rRNA processing protein RimM [Oscillospiraceae bacterium]
MGQKQFLEIGKITNVHGLRGEVKVIPWCDSA